MPDNKKLNHDSLEEPKQESYELDTSQGDFTTIAVAIFIALAIYFIIPTILGIRLGDYPVVIVYLGFVALVVFFWQIAEKVKHRNDPKD